MSEKVLINMILETNKLERAEKMRPTSTSHNWFSFSDYYLKKDFIFLLQDTPNRS